MTLALAASVGTALAGQPPLDPCGLASFNEVVCERAINEGGYFWNGKWKKATYSQPYPYYYDLYNDYLAQGGYVNAVPPESWDAPVQRGGFGSTGSTLVAVG